MSDLPPPLVPGNVDLRDFSYLPLDAVRLRDSRLTAVADAEAFRAAVLLWCAAWHQVPAASLPDDDAELAYLVGFGRAAERWTAIKEWALHGWIKCSDGRLYHQVLAEKALEAWTSKQARRARTAAATAARQVAVAASAVAPVTEDVTNNVTDTVTANVTEIVTDNATFTKGEGEGKGKGTIPPTVPPPLATERRKALLAEFERWWPIYPRREGKGQARRAYAGARAKASAEILETGARRYAEITQAQERRFIKMPTTWLNGECWMDEVVRPYEVTAALALLGDEQSLIRGRIEALTRAGCDREEIQELKPWELTPEAKVRVREALERRKNAHASPA